MTAPIAELPWWQRSVIYQVYPWSFQDANGDGIGDLEGITRRLDYLAELGVGAVWLSPFYPSPMKDFGYDVADYCDVDARFGSLADFDRLIAEAHARHIRLIVDLVPNHTSDQHPWFQASRTGRDAPKRDWYIWRDPAPDGGPPNNWPSFFGGPAWSFDAASGQYYMRLYLPEQPELNFRNPAVQAAIHDAMRFWLDRGVDGFRVDTLWTIMKDPLFRDEPPNPEWKPGDRDRARTLHTRTEDLPEAHDVARAMRRVVDEYSDRLMIGEIYLPYSHLMPYYGTAEAPEAHMPFNFRLLKEARADWTPATVRRIVEDYEAALPPGAWPNWVLGNHDNYRMATVIGEAQSRVAAMMLFTLRGTPIWYYGDELGMTNGVIPPERIQDPSARRQPHVPTAGRDPERTPMLWDASPYAGFSTVEPWLPVNADYPARNVGAQRRDPHSMLALVKRLIALRNESPLLTGAYASMPAPDGVYAYTRTEHGRRVAVLLNFTADTRRVDLGTRGTVRLSTYLDREETAESFELRPNEGLVVALGEETP